MDNVLANMERVNVMKKAVWNGQTLAESANTKISDGAIFFPDEAVKREFLRTTLKRRVKRPRTVL
jgi:hypothetical protein